MSWRSPACLRSDWAVCLLGRLLFAALLMLACRDGFAQAVTTIAAANMHVESDAKVLADEPTELPLNWDRRYGGTIGTARFTATFPWTLDTGPQAIYIRRIGTTFRIKINDIVIAEMGSGTDSREDYSKQPRYFSIPPDVLGPVNRLQIDLKAQGGRHAGLSEIEIGDPNTLFRVYTTEYNWYVTGSLVIVVASFLLGLFCLLLWMHQRDRIFLLYSAAELLWTLQVSDVLFDMAPLPWPLWGIVVNAAYAFAPGMMCLFVMALMEIRSTFLHRITKVYLWSSLPVVLLAFSAEQPYLILIWKAILLVLCLLVSGALFKRGYSGLRAEQRVVSVIAMLSVLVGLRDVVVLLILPTWQIPGTSVHPYGEIPYSRYSWLIFGLIMAWVISERLRKSGLEIIRLNDSLASRLATREQELQAVFAQQAKSERQQATMEERQRLTRDMHDGLGSELLMTLLLAENKDVSRETVTNQLRETLDHLKLTVDAMHDTEGDVASMLGALRYRLTPRLVAAGIELEWDLQPLPALEGWTLNQARDLQMILFEALSNIIAHSGADQARFEARFDAKAARIILRLSDNGKGFNVVETDEKRGQGLRNMRSRAARMKADLLISSSKGTRIVLMLPLT
jgi:hypothetical protein